MLLADGAHSIEPGSVAVGSSEGGLFDYGSDEEILANLAASRRHAA